MIHQPIQTSIRTTDPSNICHKVHTLMISKIPGIYYTKKVRPLYDIEADLILLLRHLMLVIKSPFTSVINVVTNLMS